MLQVIKNTDKRHFSHPALLLSAKSSVRNSALIITMLPEAHKAPGSTLGALFLVLIPLSGNADHAFFLIGSRGLSENRSKYRIIFRQAPCHNIFFQVRDLKQDTRSGGGPAVWPMPPRRLS